MSVFITPGKGYEIISENPCVAPRREEKSTDGMLESSASLDGLLVCLWVNQPVIGRVRAGRRCRDATLIYLSESDWLRGPHPRMTRGVLLLIESIELHA